MAAMASPSSSRLTAPAQVSSGPLIIAEARSRLCMPVAAGRCAPICSARFCDPIEPAAAVSLSATAQAVAMKLGAPSREGPARVWRSIRHKRERPCYFANASPTSRATADVSAEVMFDIAATTIPRSRTITTDTTLTPSNSASKMTLTPSNSPS